MSMIKCPECKKSFSDKADHCPHCGVKNIQRAIFCSECGEKYLASAAQCPKCGAPNKSVKKNGKTEVVRADGKTALKYLLFAIFLGFWGGHLFYAGHKKYAVLTLVLGTAGFIVPIVNIFCFVYCAIQQIMGIINGATHMDNPDPLFDEEPSFWGSIK